MSLPDSPRLLAFLRALFDTNAEFAAVHDAKFFAKFHDTQTPNLTILKCSDSRVQMESFDKTPQNGIFAIRNIGNQISTCEGSIDFGIEILNTPFLLIIGHSDCGAVTAALNGTKTESEFINKELGTIKITATCLEDAIVENINYQVQRALEKYRTRVDSRELIVMGAVYDFKNDFGFGHGRVVLTNINGVTDASVVKATYSKEISNLHFLEY
jgi:carbonic anhydrase